MHHLFIVDPLEKLNLQLDSSLRMAFFLSKLGHAISFGGIEDLRWLMGEPCARVTATSAAFGETIFSTIDMRGQIDWALDQFDCIHMRKDPPFDQRYLAATWFLSSVEDQIPILNPPSKLRSLNEKLLIFRFPNLAAPALAASKARHFCDFLTQIHSDAIVKPLDLFGGSGVEKLEFDGIISEQLMGRLSRQTNNDTTVKIVQPFDKAVYGGEVRAFCVGGRSLAWCLKRPKAPSFLANTSAGAVLEDHTPSIQEREAADTIAAALWAEGIAFCGLDLIGGRISEVNITSPRLLAPNFEKEAACYEEIAAFIEKTYGR